MPTSPLFQILSDIAARLDGRYPGITATIKFDLGASGCYRLVVERGACHAESGDGEATTTVRVAESDAVDLLTGKLDPMHAQQLFVWRPARRSEKIAESRRQCSFLAGFERDDRDGPMVAAALLAFGRKRDSATARGPGRKQVGADRLCADVFERPGNFASLRVEVGREDVFGRMIGTEIESAV